MGKRYVLLRDASELFLIKQRALLLQYMITDWCLDHYEYSPDEIEEQDTFRRIALQQLQAYGIYPFYDESAQGYSYRISGYSW